LDLSPSRRLVQRFKVPYFTLFKSRWILPSALFCFERAVSLGSVAKPQACARTLSRQFSSPHRDSFFALKFINFRVFAPLSKSHLTSFFEHAILTLQFYFWRKFG